MFYLSAKPSFALQVRHQPLINKDKLIRIIPAGAQLAQQLLLYHIRNRPLTTQDPEILIRTASNQRIPIIRINIHHIIIRIEPQEERHLQPSRLRSIRLFRPPTYTTFLAVPHTLINQKHLAAVRHHIHCRHMRHAPFKTMIISGQLIPPAHETFQIQRPHSTVIHSHLAATSKQRTQKRKYISHNIDIKKAFQRNQPLKAPTKYKNSTIPTTNHHKKFTHQTKKQRRTYLILKLNITLIYCIY